MKRWDAVDKCIKDWISKMEALVKMWTDQAGECRGAGESSKMESN